MDSSSYDSYSKIWTSCPPPPTPPESPRLYNSTIFQCYPDTVWLICALGLSYQNWLLLDSQYLEVHEHAVAGTFHRSMFLVMATSDDVRAGTHSPLRLPPTPMAGITGPLVSLDQMNHAFSHSTIQWNGYAAANVQVKIGKFLYKELPVYPCQRAIQRNDSGLDRRSVYWGNNESFLMHAFCEFDRS